MEIFLLVVWFLFALAGIFFAVMPPLPGPLISWLGALIYFLCSPNPRISGWAILIFGIVAVLTLVFDFLATAIGAKKFGASWRGGLGAVVGAVVFPILLSPIGLGVVGIFGGPLVGAFLGERLGGNTFRDSARAGGGAFLAFVVATIVKLCVCMLLLAWVPLAVLLGGGD
ncbi:MAG: DUF456 domain-containing protein [Opitutae bacterium]|nr:DUF456 domain-containing protein [Opitutae bacterium]MCD8299375.1 DUF456 domain-containing protein [Opitutae bacterium]